MERLLRERIVEARRQTFVGRTAERERFDAALRADVESEFVVLSVQGEGGIGKSALLRMFADQAVAAGFAAALVDGHDVRPNPESFLDRVGPLPVGPVVVLVDTYELLEPLDGWVREEFVPGLADGSLVVIAGRRPLPAAWRADPGWRAQLGTIRVGPLDTDDATRYLAATGVPPDMCVSVATALRGHPLALALVSDVFATRGRPALEGSLLGDADVLAPLASRLLDVMPDELHRRALAVCAIARFTTESLLRDVLDVADAGPMFAWLRGLSWTEAGERGLYPHDLARDVLEADLHWRDEDRYRELFGRIMGRTHRRIGLETGVSRREEILDLLFQARNHPVSGQYWNWETFGAVIGEQADNVVLDELLQLVTLHEGRDSAAIAARWLRSQPDAFTVYRRHGELAGMVAWVTLTGVDDDIRADPVAAAAWRYADEHDPPAAGEQVLLNRFTVDRELHQAPRSPAIDLNSAINIEMLATRPEIAWVLTTAHDPDVWAPFFATIGYHRVPGPAVSVGDRSYGMFARNERRPGPMDESMPPSPPTSEAPLTREAFADAVRSALRDLGRIDLLASNPLLALHQVRERGGGPEELRTTLTDAAETLRGHPRDEKLYRAIDRTYLRPAPTQERAAELLGLPFSTYRRHRRDGLARITDLLWTAYEAGPARN